MTKQKPFSNTPGLEKLRAKKVAKASVNVVKAMPIPSKKICTLMTDAAIMDLDQSQYQHSWEQVEDISREISNWIMTTAEDISRIVEQIKRFGCDRPEEFSVAVKVTNEDLKNFLDDFEKVKKMHEGKSGLVSDPFELTNCIGVFENYFQFKAKFEGVMHHTLISFTEFALEAKDRETKLAAEQQQTNEKEAQNV